MKWLKEIMGFSLILISIQAPMLYIVTSSPMPRGTDELIGGPQHPILRWEEPIRKPIANLGFIFLYTASIITGLQGIKLLLQKEK